MIVDLLIMSTALTSLIGIDELMKAVNSITNATVAPLQMHSSVIVIYFMFCYPLSCYLRYLKQAEK